MNAEAVEIVISPDYVVEVSPSYLIKKQVEDLLKDTGVTNKGYGVDVYAVGEVLRVLHEKFKTFCQGGDGGTRVFAKSRDGPVAPETMDDLLEPVKSKYGGLVFEVH